MTKLDFIDIMVDIETLGITKGSTFTQVAAVAFDVRTGNRIELPGLNNEFNQFIQLDLIPEDKYVFDDDTLEFWNKNEHNRKLYQEFLDRKSGLSEEDVIRNFMNWLIQFKEQCKELTLWGNGIVFDNVKIAEKCESYGINYEIAFYNERDVRTPVDFASRLMGITDSKLKRKFKNTRVHDAIADIEKQINYTCAIYKSINFDVDTFNKLVEESNASLIKDVDA